MSNYHVLGPGIICDTETRGRKTPGGRNLTELVLDASEGFIPLWDKDVTLQWRFQERSLEVFEDPAAAKTEIEALLGEALTKWGDAAPVRFTKEDDAWDFEIVVRAADNCNAVGCVLASAFFPGAGQQKLFIYPKAFGQSHKEQVDTLIHEIGHAFGLRHFFADVSESAFPSVKFGTHSPFSIMNYGELSELTATDRSDLKRLYEKVWSGELTKINGTPIRLMKPFHSTGSPPDAVVAGGRLRIH
jgi:reprolysin-like metallo-peptidase family M12B